MTNAEREAQRGEWLVQSPEQLFWSLVLGPCGSGPRSPLRGPPSGLASLTAAIGESGQQFPSGVPTPAGPHSQEAALCSASAGSLAIHSIQVLGTDTGPLSQEVSALNKGGI